MYRASANPENDELIAISIPARREGASVAANPSLICHVTAFTPAATYGRTFPSEK